MQFADRGGPGATARLALLSATVLGTMCNNIVNVPLRSIATGLGAPVSQAVLLVSAFVLVLAIAMPLTGWLGDHIGMRNTLIISVVVMTVAQLLAAFAPTLPVLVALRALQGLACSAIPPVVMGLLNAYYPDRRLQMMAAWAAANGVGQAFGPPAGGIVSQALGWRMIFVLVAIASAVVAVLIWGWVPAVPRRPSRLDVRGAALLTGGMGMVLVALTLVGQHRAFPAGALAAIAGVALLAAYAVTSRGQATAMVPLPVLVESRFLRSTSAAFGQMFCLGTVLVALPLVFTGPLGMSAGSAGALFFVLPAVMAISAPLSSTLSSRLGPRRALRTGLAIIITGAATTGVVAGLHRHTVVAVGLVLLMVVLGFGMALVQTPAAAGATSSPAGAYGAAVGLFNMMRFSGSASAAAWVALAYPIGSMLLLFGLVAGIAVLALAVSFAGPDPAPMTVRPLSRTSGRG